MKHKSKILSWIPSIFFFIALIAISGIGTAVNVSFELQSVVWVSFLISLCLRLVVNISSKYIGADLCVQTDSKKSYVDKPRQNFVLLSQSIDYATFEDWIIATNLKTKIDIYKEKKQNQLNKVNNKLRKIDLQIIKDKKGKKRFKFENKKKIIEAENTEEFIKSNIAYIRIKYNKLNAKDFETESELANKAQKTYSFNAPLENAKGIAKGLPLMLFITAFGSLLAYNISVGQINALSLCYDLASILWLSINGYYKIGKGIIQKLIGVYNDRAEVVSRYINEMPADRSRAYKLLEILKSKVCLKV